MKCFFNGRKRVGKRLKRFSVGEDGISREPKGRGMGGEWISEQPEGLAWLRNPNEMTDNRIGITEDIHIFEWQIEVTSFCFWNFA